MTTRIELNADFRPAIAQEELLDITRMFDTSGRLIHDGRNKLRVFAARGCDIAVKKFKRLGFFRFITRMFSPTKGYKAFRNGLKLLELGIETPTPIACIESRNRIGKPIEVFYLCRYETLTPLAEIINQPEVLKRFAEFVAHLHTLGILHRDLNNTNVTVRPEQPDRFVLIDINRMNFGPLSLRRCFHNLTRFCNAGADFEQFARYYLDSRGLSQSLLPRILKAKRAHDRAVDRKKALKHIFKRPSAR